VRMLQVCWCWAMTVAGAASVRQLVACGGSASTCMLHAALCSAELRETRTFMYHTCAFAAVPEAHGEPGATAVELRLSFE